MDNRLRELEVVGNEVVALLEQSKEIRARLGKAVAAYDAAKPSDPPGTAAQPVEDREQWEKDCNSAIEIGTAITTKLDFILDQLKVIEKPKQN